MSFVCDCGCIGVYPGFTVFGNSDTMKHAVMSAFFFCPDCGATLTMVSGLVCTGFGESEVQVERVPSK